MPLAPKAFNAANFANAWGTIPKTKKKGTHIKMKNEPTPYCNLRMHQMTPASTPNIIENDDEHVDDDTDNNEDDDGGAEDDDDDNDCDSSDNDYTTIMVIILVMMTMMVTIMMMMLILTMTMMKTMQSLGW